MTILSEAVVFDMEQAVLNEPMPLHQPKSSLRLQGGQATHHVLHALNGFLAFEVFDSLVDHDCSGESWKVAVASKL